MLILGLCGIVQAQESTQKTFDSNFVHVVYFWLNNPDSDEDRAIFERELKSFLDKSQFAVNHSWLSNRAFSDRANSKPAS